MCCREKIAEEDKRNAEAAATKENKSQALALDAMMAGSPEKLNKNKAEVMMCRESWMDMPLKSMSKAQREALKEYERQVNEVEESLRSTQRILEGERKVLEEEVIEIIKSFNTHLAEFQQRKMFAEVGISMAQQLCLSNAATLIQVCTALRLLHQQNLSPAMSNIRALMYRWINL